MILKYNSNYFQSKAENLGQEGFSKGRTGSGECQASKRGLYIRQSTVCISVTCKPNAGQGPVVQKVISANPWIKI